jgi:S-formylglutathione hydrolase FrmB
MGHSMGGGGALRAAAEHGEMVRAAIPFAPWEPEADLSRVSAKLLGISFRALRYRIERLGIKDDLDSNN